MLGKSGTQQSAHRPIGRLDTEAQWTEQRRYLGLEILAKSRLQDITCSPTDAEEVTIPAITA